MIENNIIYTINPVKRALKHLEFKQSFQSHHKHRIRSNSHTKPHFSINESHHKRQIYAASAENLGENVKKTQIFDHFHLRSQYDPEIFKMVGPCLLTNLATPIIISTDTGIIT